MMLRISCIIGFFVSGFLRIPEVLIEWVIVMGLILAPYFTMAIPKPTELTASSQPLKWFLKIVQGKAADLKALLHDENPGGPIARLILVAILVGCLLAFVRLIIFSDIQYVLAYEIIEIAMDVVVFMPAFFLIRAFFSEQFKRVERRQAEEQKRERELREWEDEVLADPDHDEDEAATVVNVVPHWNTGSARDRVAMKYLLYPSDRDIREDPVDAGREEMDWKIEELYQEELSSAKSARRTFALIGIIPFAVGWWFSVGRFVDAPTWLAQFLFRSAS